MVVFPNAKINIGLSVLSRRPDGYHNIETVFYPIELTDALEMAETGETGITFSGLPVDGLPEDNLVLKAYRLLKKDFNLPPVRFHLHKVIPPGSGLGGGSSNAASTLKMLNSWFKLKLSSGQLISYAVKLGADCAFFIDNKPAFASGIGDILTPLNLNLSNFYLVLIKPGVSISTAQAYKNIIPEQPLISVKNLETIPPIQWKERIHNDFEKSVFPLFPEIGEWKDALYELGAVFASMSGSGSAIFGLFDYPPTNIHKKIPKSILLT